MSPEPRRIAKRSSGLTGRLWYVGFACFLGITLLGSATRGPEAESAVAVPAPAEPEATTDSYQPAAPQSATMADAVHFIETARERFRDVRDYTCRLAQRERVGDKLPPETVAELDVRTQPFGVHMKWLEPRSMVGQEAIYVAGRNGGKMRVRGAGLLGAIGFLSLDVDDPRARRTSRHNITEAGLGNLIARFAEGWPNELRHGAVNVRIEEFSFAGRPCTRVETIHSANPDGFFLFGRSVVYFDKSNDLPIRVENYGWPKQAGGASDLLEEYSYLNLQLNPGLSDAVFDH
jgi:Protein of unknown function (DUF1571)